MTGPVPLPARRPETPADADFLSGLFRAHRAEAFAVPGLPPADLDALLRLQVQAQVKGLGISTDLLLALPYLLTLIALAGFVRNSRPPAGLGQHPTSH